MEGVAFGQGDLGIDEAGLAVRQSHFGETVIAGQRMNGDQGGSRADFFHPQRLSGHADQFGTMVRFGENRSAPRKFKMRRSRTGRRKCQESQQGQQDFRHCLLRFGAAAHQVADRIRDVAPFVEDCVNLVDDRSFGPDPPRKRMRSLGGGDPLGDDHPHRCEDFRQFFAAPKLFADVAVPAVPAGAGYDQVADAAQPGKGLC